MKQLTLILGNITLESDKAIVHEIAGIINFPVELESDFQEIAEAAEKTGEELCNILGAWVLIGVYKGIIEFECELNVDFENPIDNQIKNLLKTTRMGYDEISNELNVSSYYVSQVDERK